MCFKHFEFILTNLRGQKLYQVFFQKHIKKNETLPFVATWMPLEVIILSEVSQKENDKYHMVSLMWNLKCGTNESIYRRD